MEEANVALSHFFIAAVVLDLSQHKLKQAETCSYFLQHATALSFFQIDFVRLQRICFGVLPCPTLSVKQGKQKDVFLCQEIAVLKFKTGLILFYHCMQNLQPFTLCCQKVSQHCQSYQFCSEGSISGPAGWHQGGLWGLFFPKHRCFLWTGGDTCQGSSALKKPLGSWRQSGQAESL